MSSKAIIAVSGFGALVVVAFLSGRAGHPDFEGLARNMTELQVRLDRLAAQQTAIEARLQQRDRRSTALPGAGPRDARVVATNSLDSEPIADTSVDDPAAASGSDGRAKSLRKFTDDLSEALASESGQKVFGAAIADHQYRQETQRRQRMATAAIAVFAENVGLAKGPTKELTEIMLGSASEIRSVWASMRSGPGGPDMGKRVQENIARTRELRAAANEKARMLLSGDQFTTFEEESEALHDLVSGPRTRRSR
jgi:hypothetical protein